MRFHEQNALKQDKVGNNLLGALQAKDWNILKPILEAGTAQAGTVLHEPGQTLAHAYFPCETSLVSYLVILDDGQGIETALIGREGAVGGIVSQGDLPTFARAEVQLGGIFLRVRLDDLEGAKSRSMTLRNMFTRYADCLLAQLLQSVACNATHTIEQRTAGWLIAAYERTGSLNVTLTQEQLASMLGVGRSYLSRVFRDLKQAGAIETHRGRTTIHDIDRLRALACECNAAVNHHFDEVLQGVYPKAGS
ncbi:MAG TPA: Crp/Fnr family transcriptional regulator [Mesorhizobium sp.]|jgi:DNA-binding MarR family transcriptional regulator|uniref:Crp/Fnr family transcriptional regulator n=1 Tax=Mesorhizobium sp. TaxID=1871066 RepID=UPI002DDD2989|nr:Crp/Fnr family transcriptional regulator [Mesorhizobium sp.]HEV2503640.1 Crp/Fnr family transcriptional regulator [Mesorhizobium sp.]